MNGPVLVILKKVDASGKIKNTVIVDFRKLNNITAGDVFPMLDVIIILNQLGKAMTFFCLDMASGYYQVLIHPRGRQKTVFSTESGYYDFQIMCFDLKGAPTAFQKIVNSVFQGVNSLEVFIYLNDIIVVSDTLDEHTYNLVMGSVYEVKKI